MDHEGKEAGPLELGLLHIPPIRVRVRVRPLELGLLHIPPGGTTAAAHGGLGLGLGKSTA
jgi:hypothetical protein